MFKSKILKQSGFYMLFFLFFTLGYLATTKKWHKIFTPLLNDNQQIGGQYTPSRLHANGHELLFIYIGSSSCAASNIDELRNLTKRAKIHLEKLASSRGKSFFTMAIGIDLKPQNGYDHIRKFGLFNEVHVGRGWMNDSVVKYIWQEYPGAPATPQIIVLEREIHSPTEFGDRFSVNNENILVRKVGYLEIRDWANNNFPIPHSN